MENNNKNSVKKKCNRWCCVPQCKFERGRSLHIFPKNKNMREKWIVACRIGNKLTSKMVVCSSHFKKEDFVPRLNVQRATLKKCAVPSVNLPVRPLDKALTSTQMEQIEKRQQRWEKRLHTAIKEDESDGKMPSVQQNVTTEQISTECESMDETASIQENIFEEIPDTVTESPKPMDETLQSTNCEDCTNDNTIGSATESDSEAAYEAAKILLDLSNSCKSAQDKNIQIPSQNQEKSFSKPEKETSLFMRLLMKTEHLIMFTGINSVLLENLKNCIKLCEKSLNQYGSSIEERIVMCLCKLKLNLSFKCLAVLFQINRHTCSTLFIITLYSLARILKDAIYWPSKEEILRNMPNCFKKFKDTYIILDCTEIPVERSKCLQCRLRLYSHYKGCETIKYLVGISPSGLIIFISKPYGGRASDKAIFIQSKILEKLEPTRDAIMVDKGFAIETECAEARIKLIIPPKLGKNIQLSVDSITNTVDIASARVHVERAIQRMKLFNILKSKISIKMAPFMDEVCTVICGIINLSEPILSEKRF